MGLRGLSLWVLTAVCTWLAAANFVPEDTRKAEWWWPDQVMRLGLDLRGGVHIVIGPDLDAAIGHELSSIKSGLDSQLEDERITGVTSALEGDSLLVRAGSSADRDKVRKLLADDQRLEFREPEDTQLSITLTPHWVKEVRERAMLQALEVLRRRIDDPGTGIPESVVTRQGTDRILVQIPGMSRVPDIFRQTGFLEFKIVRDFALTEELLRTKYGKGLPEGTQIAFEKEKKTDRVLGAFLLPQAADMTGDELEDARVTYDNTRAERQVSFRWTPEGGRKFGALTEKHVGNQLAILLDGNVYSAPVINSRIGRDGVITGRFTTEEATDLAVILRAGALPIPVRIEEERTIGPALGADSIQSGVRASLIGLGLAVAFLLFYYRGSGAYAVAALSVNMVLLITLMMLFDGTMTLPGIAGLVLTVATAVDGNVIVFERIREELRSGRTPRAAIGAGFDKALWTILDANITNMIAGVILYSYGTGPIKGFAVTVLVGIVTSVFAVLIVTRALYAWRPGNRPVTELSI